MGGVNIYPIFDPRFIEQMKQEIPLWAREYDSDARRWYVGPDYMATALRIALRCWPQSWKMVEPDPSGWGGYESGAGPSEFWRAHFGYPPGAGRRNTRQDGARGPTSYESSPDHATLHVTASAPPEVIRAAYKALSKLYHPDAGGDVGKMQGINSAMDRLRKAGKA